MAESMKTGAHYFDAGDGMGRTVGVRAESENVRVTGRENEGLFLSVDGKSAFLKREDAETLRDFLSERYPARREVGTVTVKVVPDLTGFEEAVEAARASAAKAFEGFNLGEEPQEEEPLAEWERELLGETVEEPAPKFAPGDEVVLSGPHYIADGIEDRTYDEAPNGIGSRATITHECDAWGAGKAYSVRWKGNGATSVVATGSLSRFAIQEPGDVVGTVVYVTGDSDEWDHEFAPGTAVKIERDDVAEDGSYAVRAVKTGEYDYVGANDLALDSPRRQKITNGTRVRVLNDGHESGLRHYLKPDTYATVVGWTDTSAEEGSEYDETYQVRGASDEVGGSLTQSVTPATIEAEDDFQAIMRRYLEGYPRRFVTGLDPATRVDFRDPAVRTWESALRSAPIMAIPDEVQVRRRRCWCGSTSCPIGPFRDA